MWLAGDANPGRNTMEVAPPPTPHPSLWHHKGPVWKAKEPAEELKLSSFIYSLLKKKKKSETLGILHTSSLWLEATTGLFVPNSIGIIVILIVILLLNKLAALLTLDVEHPLHADLVHPLLAQLGADAEHLVGVGRHHADAALVQLAPRHRPLLPQLLHPLHDLKDLPAAAQRPQRKVELGRRRPAERQFQVSAKRRRKKQNNKKQWYPAGHFFFFFFFNWRRTLSETQSESL